MVPEKIKKPQVKNGDFTTNEAEVPTKDSTDNNVTHEESIETYLEDDISDPEP